MMIHKMLETRNEKKNTAIEMNHEKGQRNKESSEE